MQNFDFNNAPKLICDGTATGINKSFISIAIKTGQNATVFAMPPEDAKNFSDALVKTLEGYVASYGPIADSSKPVMSPIDLSGDGSTK